MCHTACRPCPGDSPRRGQRLVFRKFHSGLGYSFLYYPAESRASGLFRKAGCCFLPVPWSFCPVKSGEINNHPIPAYLGLTGIPASYTTELRETGCFSVFAQTVCRPAAPANAGYSSRRSHRPSGYCFPRRCNWFCTAWPLPDIPSL